MTSPESSPAAAWMAEAACRGAGPDAFHPVTGRGQNTVDVVARARAVCAQCPVTDPCLGYALAHPSVVGVWGGRTARERQKIRRSRRQNRRTT